MFISMWIPPTSIPPCSASYVAVAANAAAFADTADDNLRVAAAKVLDGRGESMESNLQQEYSY
jgi:hypothetical protein